MCGQRAREFVARRIRLVHVRGRCAKEAIDDQEQADAGCSDELWDCPLKTSKSLFDDATRCSSLGVLALCASCLAFEPASPRPARPLHGLIVRKRHRPSRRGEQRIELRSDSLDAIAGEPGRRAHARDSSDAETQAPMIRASVAGLIGLPNCRRSSISACLRRRNSARTAALSRSHCSASSDRSPANVSSGECIVRRGFFGLHGISQKVRISSHVRVTTRARYIGTNVHTHQPSVAPSSHGELLFMPADHLERMHAHAQHRAPRANRV